MNPDPKSGPEIDRIRRRLEELATETDALKSRLSALEAETTKPSSPTPSATEISSGSPAEQKLALFRRLFAGRQDVFAVRWENTKSGKSGYAPACNNEWVKRVCGKPQVKCGACPNQAFLPLNDYAVARHLGGDGAFVVGVYALLPGDMCRFLAVDFDGAGWADDARAFVATCRAQGIAAALERSRSGEGGHVWIFFAEPVAAHDARRLGAMLVTRTMERRPDLGFRSYDRFFPSQDTLPIGGFGNLIALPLQRRARESGNSVFIDDALLAYPDQWSFLSAIRPLTAADLADHLAKAELQAGSVFGGVRLPVDDENADQPWMMSPSRRPTPVATAEVTLPAELPVVIADQVYVERAHLPTGLVAQLIRLAAFQNPEFYRAQAMRLAVFDKPRIISCAELHPKHIALPRGCLDETVALLAANGTRAAIEDRREAGTNLSPDLRFLGQLSDDQVAAFDDLSAHDFGVLAATTAFGKTVVAAALIARRGCNTLILVHRRELLTQWVERLKTFLSVGAGDIGTIAGGRRKPSGRIDVALIQSLVRRGEVDDLVAGYGLLVVDECHHISAASFELVARRAKARYVLGLSATVARKDGHHPIIFMQCGPVRHRVDARSQAARRSFEHVVRLRPTAFRLPPELASADRPPMPAIYAALARDEARNTLIFDDVLEALEAKRAPLILTERRDHLDLLERRFARFTRNLVVLRAGMSAAERKTAEAALRVPENHERLVLATGRYLGEGFDDARLDTLFLTLPISWRGTLAQYVGRLHRAHAGKREVIVYDYVDDAVPLLRRMAAMRQPGYQALGYRIA